MKKKFLLRIDENIYAALEKWAADELRSTNAQIEYLLQEMLKKHNRIKKESSQGINKSADDSAAPADR